MKIRKLALGLIVGALALTAACGREGAPPAAGGDGGPAGADAQLTYEVATDVTLTGSPTFDRMKQAGKVVIGIREDQPGLGFKDATTGARSGFDVEIARMVAAGLGYGDDKIEYKAVPSAAREDTISRGDIDFMVGTYTINDNRKQRVSFAGPYFVAGQGLLVRKDETEITGKDTLKGKKVCSVTGSTPIQRVREQGLTEPENIVEFQTYSQCVDQLLSRQVDAVTTDDAILKGYAAQAPDDLKVVGEAFSVEPYGIGLAKDDAVLRGKINDLLQAAMDDGTWQKIYDATLGKSGSAAEPPAIERY
ncbi:amino acid ABC transporter substrate-binding protein, PAAT family [Pseudonocardia thermophila]|jgi:ABC-type amino acid transport/signal transduction systems, periplasmic component/domain|uniref:Amino acid ABC transporter substrate-binding protein, PAAT family n=1 Tax=Pseudonocardia thermophila TaxID=1848 RepID=A0A1M6QVW2_PSETH|nr:glutamate ABC transporter substrate-binding protein [Pseudonocardia thermophila]SHK24336.1 amino acid ABC transporter substrate-binding protein, PAAT family [Pseudonocardia thermophila]